MEKDAYKTLLKPGEETLFKEKGSKFFGYAFPVTSEEEVNQYLEELKNKHHKARHFCYAWQLGKQYQQFRANDDGEPSNSAGMPIYGQLQSFEVTNCLVVSVRYFGGTKLGVGGLISAYKTSAQLAIEASTIIEKTIDLDFQVKCNYDMMNVVMRLVKDLDLVIKHQNLEMDCDFLLSVRKKDFTKVFHQFKNTYGLKVKSLEEEE